MADDFQVKQSSSNSGAYGLTGAVIGGAAAAAAVPHFTKPKYGSYDDIIKEAKDSADFSAKIDKASGEEKTFLQSAKDLASKEKAAAETYDKEFKAYAETHKNGYVEDDAFKKYQGLVEKRNAAEKEFADKKAELEKAEVPAKAGKSSGKIEKVKKMIADETKNIEELNKSLSKDLKETVEDMYKSASEMTELDNKIIELRNERAKTLAAKGKAAPEVAVLDESIEKLTQTRKELKKVVEDLEKHMETEVRKELPKEMHFPKGKDRNKLIDEKVREIKSYLHDSIQERTLNDAKVKEDIAKIAENKETAIKNFKELTKNGKGFEGVDLAGKSAEEVEKLSGRHINTQKKQLEKLESFKELYKQAEAKAKSSKGATTVVEEYKAMLGKWETPITIKRTLTTPGEEVKKFIDTLTDKEKETFTRLVEGGDEAAIDKAIKARKDKITELEKAIGEIKKADARVAQLGGEGAYINKGVLYNAEGVKVEIKPDEVKIAEDVKYPKTAKLRSLEEQLAKLEEKSGAEPARKNTEAEIKEKLAAETKKVENAKKAVEEAEKRLTKGEAKTEAQLVEEFNKLKGNKSDFVKKEVESAKEEFVKKSESFLKRRYGFEGSYKTKLGLAIAAGAVLVGGIASALAPKKN